jgi:hypothetical protein
MKTFLQDDRKQTIKTAKRAESLKASSTIHCEIINAKIQMTNECQSSNDRSRYIFSIMNLDFFCNLSFVI